MGIQRSRRFSGFTLLEILLVVTLTGLVVAGMLRALTAQKRYYARQTRILDARHALRAASTILGSELREVSASGGDLYFVASDSIGFRSTVGFGLVCGIDSNTLNLTRVSGHFQLVSGDSLLLFVEESERDSDDYWRALHVSAISTSGTCANGAAAERSVTVEFVPGGVWIGTPVRLFRPYVYGLFQTADDRWWLGRRLTTESEFAPVAGPLAPPGADGLELEYRDTADQPTSGLAEIVRIGISVRAPTDRTLSDPAYRSLNTSTYLRNDG